MYKASTISSIRYATVDFFLSKFHYVFFPIRQKKLKFPSWRFPGPISDGLCVPACTSCLNYKRHCYRLTSCQGPLDGESHVMVERRAINAKREWYVVVWDGRKEAEVITSGTKTTLGHRDHHNRKWIDIGVIVKSATTYFNLHEIVD